MVTANQRDLPAYCEQLARQAKAAAADLAVASGEQKNGWLHDSARRLRSAETQLLKANAADLEAAPGYGLTDAQVDRLATETLC